jgi:isoleucyl-tRNA synthetase
VNQALAYGPEVWYEHFEIKSGELDERPDLAWLRDKRFLVAKELLPSFLKRLGLLDNADWSLGAYLGGLQGTLARHPMHHLGGFYATSSCARRTGSTPSSR